MKSRIYKKIFLSFAIIIVIYTCIILFLILSHEINNQKKQSIETINVALEKKTNDLDSALKLALDYTNTLVNDDLFESFSVEKNEDYSHYSLMFDRLSNNIFSKEQFSYSLGILSTSQQKVVGLNGYFDMDDYFNYIKLDKNNDIVKSFFSNNNTEETIILTSDTKYFLLRKKIIANQNTPLFFIFDWEKDKRFASLGLDYNSQIDVTDMAGLSQLFGNQVNVEQSPARGATFSLVDLNADRYAVFTKLSTALPNVVYYYTIPTSDLFRIPKDTIRYMLSPLIAFLIMGLLLSIIFSKTNYKPYKKIITKISDESEDIKEIGMGDLLRDIEQMKSNNLGLKRFQKYSIDDMREFFFRNILLERYSTKELTDIAEFIGLSFLEDGGIIVLMTMSGEVVLEKGLSYKEISRARQKIIEHTILHDMKSPVIQPLNTEQFILIFSTDIAQNIIEQVTKIRTMLDNELNLSSKFVVSTSFSSISNFYNVFKDLVGMDHEDLTSNDMISLTTKNQTRIEHVYSLSVERKLINLIKLKKVNEAREQVESILHLNFLDKKLDVPDLKELKNSLLYTIKRVGQDLQIDLTNFYQSNQELFDDLNILDSQILYTRFLQLFDELFQFLDDDEPYISISTKESVLKYIDKNYQDDISLSQLAEVFQLTESYISRLVKSASGISFKDYLNQLKVDKAKELLYQSHYKVSEVSELVGCKNVNSFIRIFKKYEGITPGSFQSQSRLSD